MFKFVCRGFLLFLFLLMIVFNVAGIAFASSKEAAEIELWHFGGLDTELKYIPEVIAAFQEANPGITVKRTHFPWDSRLEKLIVASRQKTLPDVIMNDSFEVPNMVEMGILTAYDVEFPEYLEKWKPLFVENIWEQVSTYKGHKYGITPYTAMGPMIVFSPEVFAKAGLDPNKPPQTWSDLIEYSRKLKAAGFYGVSLSASKASNDMMSFMDIAYQNGGRWLNPDGTKVVINGPGCVDALKMYKRLLDEGLIQPGAMQTDYVDALKLVVQKKAGFAFGKDWVHGILFDLGSDPDEKFSLSLMPRPDRVTGTYPPVSVTNQGGSDLMIISTSENKDAAVKLVDYFATEKVLRGWGGDPIRGRVPSAHIAFDNPAFEKNNPFLYELYKEGTLFEGSISGPAFRGLGEMYTYISDAIHAVFLGKVEPQEALDEAQKQCQKVLDQYLE
ncbi:MAG: extracellular solute-binding protein, partial [Spirochaetes bacterium]|nr:extracellular solute-binding protein [Spirochaetota bacterium]